MENTRLRKEAWIPKPHHGQSWQQKLDLLTCLPLLSQLFFQRGERKKENVYFSELQIFPFVVILGHPPHRFFCFFFFHCFTVSDCDLLSPVLQSTKDRLFSASLLLFRDHNTIDSWVCLEGSQAAEAFQHRNTVPPRSGSGKSPSCQCDRN